MKKLDSNLRALLDEGYSYADIRSAASRLSNERDIEANLTGWLHKTLPYNSPKLKVYFRESDYVEVSESELIRLRIYIVENQLEGFHLCLPEGSAELKTDGTIDNEIPDNWKDRTMCGFMRYLYKLTEGKQELAPPQKDKTQMKAFRIDNVIIASNEAWRAHQLYAKLFYDDEATPMLVSDEIPPEEWDGINIVEDRNQSVTLASCMERIFTTKNFETHIITYSA